MQNFPSEILEQIRVHLENEKTAISKQIEELDKQDPFSDPSRVNDNVADGDASEESDHDRVSAMVNELNDKRAAIDDALIRIGEGTYGFCQNCGNMIDTDRLSVLPMATLCKHCEEEKAKKITIRT